eukprot:TRINITY_DN9328_c0_g1_i1.p1 TRINITY_DN9328_c0_g1~~TRINITY_DN9328_c0_g1_i1.p1  ORF type:complete len:470 (-),score=51.27 TRINITY_DN9328_c0_g1_i1:45-1454(-)
MKQGRLLYFCRTVFKTQNVGSHNKNYSLYCANLTENTARFSARNFGSFASNSKADNGSLLSKYCLLYQRFLKKGYDCVKSSNMSTSVAFPASRRSVPVKEAVKSLEASGLVTKGQEVKVAAWLFGCATWVFSMVLLGGVTRLTRSGLSMTDWKFTGNLPPSTDEEWQLEFDKYKQSPEYKRVNKGMSLQDFKFIYWMEYAHRMWGRALGIVFAGPFLYFVSKGYIKRQLSIRLSALFAMGAAQGLIGWWMVKSGLQEPESEYVEPRVSPYRLATHLTSAFVIYCGILWTGLSVAMPEPPTDSVAWVQGAAKVRRIALPVSAVVALTAISGAFVAGNDAGRAFNTFPKMGDNWIPGGLFDLKPLIRNFFENTATVQLDHRILATATLASICGMWLATRKVQMHPAVKGLLTTTVGMAALQVILGVSTLLHYVPVELGTAHQAGALALFTMMILLVHATRPPSPLLLKKLS